MDTLHMGCLLLHTSLSGCGFFVDMLPVVTTETSMRLCHCHSLGPGELNLLEIVPSPLDRNLSYWSSFLIGYLRIGIECCLGDLFVSPECMVFAGEHGV